MDTPIRASSISGNRTREIAHVCARWDPLWWDINLSSVCASSPDLVLPLCPWCIRLYSAVWRSGLLSSLAIICQTSNLSVGGFSLRPALRLRRSYLVVVLSPVASNHPNSNQYPFLPVYCSIWVRATSLRRKSLRLLQYMDSMTNSFRALIPYSLLLPSFVSYVCNRVI